MRILIAEDDLVLADGLLRTLRASGAAADHVASGTEAEAALMTSDQFDLLILDLGLPQMHGLDVLKALRNDARTARLPVLVVSADALEAQIQRALESGANGYITKPFSMQTVLDRVDEMLADNAPPASI